MIDSLARHIAALLEARRLVAMVLANNPAFGAHELAVANGLDDEARRLAGLLSADSVYLAYEQLGSALVQAQSMVRQECVVEGQIDGQVIVFDTRCAREPNRAVLGPERVEAADEPVRTGQEALVAIVHRSAPANPPLLRKLFG
jgi:hypothetical protein